MPITESKNRNGTLTLGDPGTDFAVQTTAVTITPSYTDTGEPLETLSGDMTGTSKTRGNTLRVESIQDFTDPDGFVAFTWENDLQAVSFVWEPNGDTGPSYAGTVTVLACEVGGTVNQRLTTSVEWEVQGAVTVTQPTGAVLVTRETTDA